MNRKLCNLLKIKIVRFPVPPFYIFLFVMEVVVILFLHLLSGVMGLIHFAKAFGFVLDLMLLCEGRQLAINYLIGLCIGTNHLLKPCHLSCFFTEILKRKCSKMYHEMKIVNSMLSN